MSVENIVESRIYQDQGRFEKMALKGENFLNFITSQEKQKIQFIKSLLTVKKHEDL